LDCIYGSKPGAAIPGTGAARDGNCNSEQLDRLIHQLDRLRRSFGLDGYGLEAQIEKILPEMGFEPAMAIASSVQRRLADANELGQDAAKPDLLLLDETGFRND